jgi:hypothetical protein
MSLYGTVSPGFPLSYKNLVINGAFDHWQRATSANISGGYGSADRWCFSNGGTPGSQCTFSRSTFSPGALQPGENSTYYATIAANSNTFSTGGISLRHHIEGVRSIPSGQTFTVSFWFRSSQVTNVGVNCFNFFNSSNSYEQIDTTKYSSTIPLNTWTKLSYTFTQNSLSGKTITTGNDSILIQIQNNSTFSGANTMDFAEVQVELGPVATNFERRPLGLELALCQRYYYYAGTTQGGGYQDGTSNLSGCFLSPVRMRTTPTMSVGNSTYIWRHNGYTMQNSPSVTVDSYTGCSVQFTITGYTGGVNGYSATWYTSAISLSAELS